MLFHSFGFFVYACLSHSLCLSSIRLTLGLCLFSILIGWVNCQCPSIDFGLYLSALPFQGLFLSFYYYYTRWRLYFQTKFSLSHIIPFAYVPISIFLDQISRFCLALFHMWWQFFIQSFVTLHSKGRIGLSCLFVCLFRENWFETSAICWLW